jgi:hypothetical protein
MLVFAQPTQGADTVSIPAVNLPFVSLASRFLPGTSPRNELVLLAPAGIGDAARSGAVIGGLYLDAITFSSKNEYTSSSTGVGKLYYLPSYEASPSIYVVPYMTIYRMMGIWYRDISGTRTDLWEHHWGLVGVQLLIMIGEDWAFHADVDPYAYSRVENNYRLFTGISRRIAPGAAVSAVYARTEWDIEASKDATHFKYAGSSESMYVKGIYEIKSQGKRTGVNLFVSTGYEHLLNAGNNSQLSPGDIAVRGWMLNCGITLGKVSW